MIQLIKSVVGNLALMIIINPFNQTTKIIGCDLALNSQGMKATNRIVAFFQFGNQLLIAIEFIVFEDKLLELRDERSNRHHDSTN
jgi:hypothetical protein